MVVHSAPTAGDVIFGAELRAMAGQGRIRLVEKHTDTDGMLDVARLDDLVDDVTERQTWACGPAGMLDALEQHWAEAGIADRLHTERFRATVVSAGDGGLVNFTKSDTTVDADGADTLLDAGEAAGVLMPSGCRMGICFGCVAPLREGAVRDLRNGEITTAAPGTASPSRPACPPPRARATSISERPQRQGVTMTTLQAAQTDPIAHLTAEDIENIGRELDAIRAATCSPTAASATPPTSARSSTGSASSNSAAAPCCCSRCSRRPGSLGTAGLSISKILENMEIGHNVLHGQWDWMRDPKIHSTTWEWDNVSPSEQWKHSHNELHHTYTNVLGKDNDLGYGIMRVDEDQRWMPFYLAQPLWNFINACLFEYGIAAYDLELGKHFKGRVTRRSSAATAQRCSAKIRKQVAQGLRRCTRCCPGRPRSRR